MRGGNNNGPTIDQVAMRIKLIEILDQESIAVNHIYQPARDSVKAIFPTESEIDKVMSKIGKFKEANLEPRMSMALKACHTIFCTNFDPAILQAYSNDRIKEILVAQEWKVREVYIMRSGKSMKIEMETRKQAIKFLEQEQINIGGIRINEEQKEQEIDPTIKQCWECGELNPTHSSATCPGRKICLKCGSHEHKFFDCWIPRKDLNEEQKRGRYCKTCAKKTDHTSLDHRLCPIKRNLLREKATAERERKGWL